MRPLSADAAELAGPESWERLKDRGNEWLEMHHSVGRGENEKHPERQRRDVLLELDTLVHREQRVVLPTHAPKQITVLDPGLAAGHDGGRGMALEHGGEV